MSSLTVQEWPTLRLVAYEKNPRKNDHVVEKMAKAIKEFGFKIPIVAKSDGTVVDGHLRLKAAISLGLETVPVALADDLSEAQIKAFRLLANKSAEWADWDESLLKIELCDLAAMDFDLSPTGFKEVEFDIKELSKVKLEKIKLGLDTREINAQIKDAKNSLTGLKTAVKDTGGQIGGQFTKQVGNGSNTLMQFSRIAQDAPFGIMGIGNNITATAESFGYLKQQTGSTSGALKAMASSLMGTGGILLGVSLLTTGFTLLAQSGLSVGDIIDKVTGKFDEFGNAIKTASEEGVKATANEVFGLKALVSASQNKALSDKDRLIAVEQLQKQYPGYFGNLSKEQIMTSNLTGVVNELTKALVDRAIAEKLAGASADIQLGIYKTNAGLLKQKQETLKLEKELATLVGNSTKDELYADNQKFIAVTNLNGQIRASKLAENEYRTEIVKGTKAIEQRQNVINKLTASSIKLEQSGGKGAKPKQTFNTPQVGGLQSSIVPVGLVVSPIDTTPITTAFTGIRETVSSELLATQELLYNFSTDVNELVIGSLGNTFSDLGNSIGEALANGQNVFSAIGNSLLVSLGNFLSDMGGLLIKYGVLAVAKGKLDLAIATGGPISIGAGIAAIAVGVLLKAAGGAIGAKAKGGAGQTSTATGSGANNTSTTSGSTGGWSGGTNGTVVFEIAGTSLIGVLNNTTARNLRIGGR